MASIFSPKIFFQNNLQSLYNFFKLTIYVRQGCHCDYVWQVSYYHGLGASPNTFSRVRYAHFQYGGICIPRNLNKFAVWLHNYGCFDFMAMYASYSIPSVTYISHLQLNKPINKCNNMLSRFQTQSQTRNAYTNITAFILRLYSKKLNQRYDIIRELTTSTANMVAFYLRFVFQENINVFAM